MRHDAATRRLERAPLPGPTLVWAGKDATDHLRPAAPTACIERLAARDAAPAPWTNQLYWGDNLDVAHALVPSLRGKVDLVYIDPPFATGALFEFRAGDRGNAVAYRDRWEHGPTTYLSSMLVRLRAMRELLSERGSIFVHCDWRTSHWMRCLLDEVFGAECFKNEIVWRYRRWPAKTRILQRMHDVIFWYGKAADDLHAFQTMYEPLAPSTLATWGTRKQVADFSSGRRKPSQLEIETLGAPLSDVWDVGIIAPIAHERLGYPTQKPEALIRRVVELATRPDDLVADFFCGSGTTLAVAEKLGRRWVGCDLGRIAIHTARRRLLSLANEGRRSGFDLIRCGPVEAGEPGPAAQPALVRRGDKVAVELRRGPGKRGRIEEVDMWSIDLDGSSRARRGQPMAHHWWSMRSRRGDPVETCSPALELASARATVQLVDALGNTTTVQLSRR